MAFIIKYTDNTQDKLYFKDSNSLAWFIAQSLKPVMGYKRV